jgi:predicted Zn finger-like uncharacterized protein
VGVVVRCPSCQTAYKVADESLGGRARCKKCGATITIEISRDETRAVAAAQPGKSSPDVNPLPVEEGRVRAGQDSPSPQHSPKGRGSTDPDASLSTSEPLPTIAPYVSHRRLGQGGMGVVYLAVDPRLDRKVAIKLLPADLAQDKVRIERFLREARMAAKVQHANTVIIHEVDVRDGKAFLVMEYVEGHSLDQAIRGGKQMDWREATKAIRDAAAGLAAAHELGVVHRDIKPGNLMRTKSGVTKVVDFGLARAIQSDTQLTQEGFLLGTPAYMAPELWMGKEADAASDLYALICSYFYLLTGRTPYDAPSLPSLGYQHRYEPFPDPHKLAPKLPDSVCQIVMRGAAKEPKDRYGSAAELLRDLDRALGSTPQGSSERSFLDDLGSDLGPLATASETEGVALNTQVGVLKRLRAAAPPWYAKPRTWMIAAGTALPLLLLAVVMLVKTSYGTVQIELSDPAAKVHVQVDGDTIDIAGLKDPLRIKAGLHNLNVTSGDFQTVTQAFEVKRGETEFIKVTLLPKAAVAVAQSSRSASPGAVPLAKTNAETTDSKSAAQPQDPAARAAVAKIFKIGGWYTANTRGSIQIIRDAKDLPPDLSDIYWVSFDSEAGRNVVDTDLENLSCLSKLKEVRLATTRVTGEGLRHIAPNPELFSLHLQRTSLNDIGLAEVGKLSSIRDLRCDDTKITDAGLVHLRNLPLEVLVLRNTAVTDAGLVHLENMPLKSLDLLKTKITDAGVSQITRIQTLENLTIDQNPISDAGVKDIGRLSRLRGLYVNYTQLSDASLNVLPAQLERLHISCTRVTSKGLQGIGRFTNLKDLWLMGNKINDGLHFLSNCPKLASVMVQESDITDSGLAMLANCPRLTVFDANRTALRGRGIGKLPNLQRLNLYQTNTDKTTVDEIATLGKLTSLDLGSNKLLDTELASIGKMETLTDLSLHANNLTDAILPEVAKLVHLKKLDLTNNPKITAAAVDKLRGELKQCNIIFSQSGTAGEVASQKPAAPAAQIETPKHKAGTTWTNNLGMTFAYIPAGQYINEMTDAPIVTLSHSYMMQTTEVTQDHFNAIMGFNPSRFKGPELPVHSMSWNDATEYCRRLTERDRHTYRLPTASEFRYANQAGAFDQDDKTLDAQTWYIKNSKNEIHPVGRLQPNAWGLYDMRGNVFEFCQDWWEPPYKREGVDPVGPATGKNKAVASGAFDQKSSSCRTCWVSSGGPPTGRGHLYGFRPIVVLKNDELPPSPAPPDFAKLVHKVGDTWTNSLGMKFAYIPLGEFMMGSPLNEPGRSGDKDPPSRNETLHKVQLTKPFLLGSSEVTRAQFAQFVNETGYKTSAEAERNAVSGPFRAWEKLAGVTWREPGFQQDINHPVVCVSWDDCVALASWLSVKEGITYRLPTEAEWEYASRAGKQTAYPWGANPTGARYFANLADLSTKQVEKDINAATWYDGFPFTAPIGSFKPNAWGLYDMCGNVAEWCSDLAGGFPSGTQRDPQGPTEQQADMRSPGCHEFRGHSWASSPDSARSASRTAFYGGHSYSGTFVGFRLAVELPADGQAAATQFKQLTPADEAAADPEFAKLLQQAASGSADAMCVVGQHYLKQEDYESALPWLRKSAEANHPTALRELARMYDSGRSVAADHTEAMKLFRRAAAGGDAWAMYSMGTFYEEGQGVKKDIREALRWYRKSANVGNDARPMQRLAELYETGSGVKKDPATALQWLRKSAGIGREDPVTYVKLGNMYQQGIGTKKDSEEAIKWYTKATEKGNIEAMRAIGDLYDVGRGIAKNTDQAAAWYRKAAAAGDQKAKDWLTAHKLAP